MYRFSLFILLSTHGVQKFITRLYNTRFFGSTEALCLLYKTTFGFRARIHKARLPNGNFFARHSCRLLSTPKIFMAEISWLLSGRNWNKEAKFWLQMRPRALTDTQQLSPNNIWPKLPAQPSLWAGSSHGLGGGESFHPPTNLELLDVKSE